MGGDASFYKAELEGQLSRPILPGLVSLTSRVVVSRLTFSADDLFCYSNGFSVELYREDSVF